MAYTNSNFAKVVSFVDNVYTKSVKDTCDEFGYRDHIVGLLTLSENVYKYRFPDTYKTIIDYYDGRCDFRTPFECCRDICANFIVEDLFRKPINEKHFPSLYIRLNENETRDIEKYPTSLPDFIYINQENKKAIRVDLKLDWGGYACQKNRSKRKYFFRGRENEVYKKNDALALIWSPYKNKFTIVDFRENIVGMEGTDSSKGGKEGFWVSLENNVFEDIYFNYKENSIFMDNVIRRIDKLAKQKK